MWARWMALPGASFSIGSEISAVSPRPGDVSLFGVDETGTIKSMYYDSSFRNVKKEWSSWFELSKAEPSCPAFIVNCSVFTKGTPVTSISARPGGVSLFAIDQNGIAETNYFDPNAENRWMGFSLLSKP